MSIEPHKVQKFTELFSEFVANYLTSSDGQAHIQLYSKGREEGRANFKEVLAAVQRGENVTDLVLQKLLPHANTDGNRAKGAWIHIAPSVNKDVKAWFEGASWTKADDWPKIAQAVLKFVSRCNDAPNDLSIACAEFNELPYTKGFQTGMLTPILNALRQDDFLLINSKSRVVINDLAGTNFNLGLLDYPETNTTGKRLIRELAKEMSQQSKLDMRAEDLFDMFCHWLVAIKRASFRDVSFWKIAPGDNAWQWEECHKDGFIAIGWEDFGDISNFSRAEFNKRRDELIATHSDWAKAGLEQVWKFSRIREGDRVVANRGTNEVLGIGTVIGPYYFVPDTRHGHRLPVNWDDATTRQVNEGGWRRTLVEIDKEKFEAICQTPSSAETQVPVAASADNVSLTGDTTWGGSLHQSFRLLPEDRRSPNLRPFMEADGQTQEQVLARLPYDKERSSTPAGGGPDPKRYRDGKQVYQTGGLLYEQDGKVFITELGHAVRRWLDILTPQNRTILARHAAYALAACQLRNPTGSGRKYAATVSVFPFSFIWRAMLALDGRISSNELNRSLFRVKNESELQASIQTIREARLSSKIELLGEETISGKAKNDRIIPWVSLASFGWTLFRDKRAGDDGDYYELDTQMLPIIKEAAQVRHRHREFGTTSEYIEYVSRCAALPKDLR